MAEPEIPAEVRERAQEMARRKDKLMPGWAAQVSLPVASDGSEYGRLLAAALEAEILARTAPAPEAPR